MKKNLEISSKAEKECTPYGPAIPPLDVEPIKTLHKEQRQECLLSIVCNRKKWEQPTCPTAKG